MTSVSQATRGRLRGPPRRRSVLGGGGDSSRLPSPLSCSGLATTSVRDPSDGPMVRIDVLIVGPVEAGVDDVDDVTGASGGIFEKELLGLESLFSHGLLNRVFEPPISHRHTCVTQMNMECNVL